MESRPSNDHGDIRIRFATSKDTGLILGFIQALAEYEKLVHEVVLDEPRLHEELFGDRPSAEVVIAELHGTAVGFALFFHNFSTFLGRRGLYLEDLFVKEEVRGLGVGRRLLVELARIAVERGCGRFEWWVLDWNRPAIEFYDRLGAVAMDDWTVFRLSGEALDKLAAEDCSAKV